MSISNTTESAILSLIFEATAWANYADNAASTPQTNIHTALHYDDPADTGTMSTNEASYSSYARVSVARSTSGFTVTAGSVSPDANIDFASSGGAEPNGGGSLDFFSFGKTGGGAAAILWSGAVSPAIAVGASGITPRLTTATACTLD
jgi:hypothetical protein